MPTVAILQLLCIRCTIRGWQSLVLDDGGGGRQRGERERESRMTDTNNKIVWYWTIYYMCLLNV